MLQATIIVDMKHQHIIDLHHAILFSPNIVFLVIRAIFVIMMFVILLSPEDVV